jgi:hypothetical protein
MFFISRGFSRNAVIQWEQKLAYFRFQHLIKNHGVQGGKAFPTEKEVSKCQSRVQKELLKSRRRIERLHDATATPDRLKNSTTKGTSLKTASVNERAAELITQIKSFETDLSGLSSRLSINARLALNEARFKRAIARKKLEMPLNTWFAGKWII